MSESLEVDFVLETVEQMVKRHGVSLNKETVIHSDQGTHYTSLKFIQLVESRELRRSMSRRGNCWDNAPQESFFGHMKDELAGEMPGWTSFAEARDSVDRWMEYYNRDRCQWDLAKLSPDEYYHYISQPHGGLEDLVDVPHGLGTEALGLVLGFNAVYSAPAQQLFVELL